MTSLTLGSAVETIGSKAFYNSALTSLTIPDSVTSIGVLAFAKVPIKTLVVGKGLADQSSIGGGAFYGVCPTLESVSINSPNALGRGNRTNIRLPWMTYAYSYGNDYVYPGLHFTQGPVNADSRYYGSPRDPAAPVPGASHPTSPHPAPRRRPPAPPPRPARSIATAARPRRPQGERRLGTAPWPKQTIGSAG